MEPTAAGCLIQARRWILSRSCGSITSRSAGLYGSGPQGEGLS
jgi:hypothetical protein